MTESNREPAIQKEDYLSKGARGGALSFAVKTGSTLLAFLNQVLLARILGAEGIGEVLLAVSVVKIFGLVGKFGMEEAMMRFVPSYVGKNDNARLRGALSFSLQFSLLLSVVLGVVLWLCSNLLATGLFHSEGLARILPFAAVAIPLTVVYEVIGGIMKGFKETMKALLPQFLISPLLRIVLFLYLSLFASDPLYAIVAYIAGDLLAMIVAIAFLRNKTRGIRALDRQTERRKIFNVAYTMIFTGFGVYLFTQADLWMVGMLTSTEDVGIYGVTAKLVTLTAFPLSAFSAIIPPLISSIHTSGDLDELKRVVRGSSRWIFSASMPIILTLFLEGNIILKYLFGANFAAGHAALLILLAGQVVNAGAGLVGYFLQMTGEHKGYMKIMIFFSIANIILNFLLIPLYGINGAAMSTAVCLAMINIVSVIAVYKKVSVLTLAKGLGFDALFIAVVVIIYMLCRHYHFDVGYHILLAFSLAVYLGKSFMKNDIPWRLILTKYRPG